MKNIKCQLIIIFFLSFFITQLNAATITSKRNGNWSDTATWIGNIIPVLADDVVISNGDTISILSNTSCNSITFANNITTNTTLYLKKIATLTVTGQILFNGPSNGTANIILDVDSANLNCGSIVMNNSGNDGRIVRLRISTGTVNVTGDFNFTTTNNLIRRQLIITSNGTVNINGSGRNIATCTFNPNSTIHYSSSNNSTIWNTTYENLIVSGTGIKLLVGNTTVNGVLSLNGSVIQLADYDLTLSNIATFLETQPYSNTNMIETNGMGRLIKQDNVVSDLQLTYPIGSGNAYSPLVLTNIAATLAAGSSISLRTVPLKHALTSSSDFIKRYWNIETNAITNFNITNAYLQYADLDIIGSETSIDSIAVFQLGSWNKNITGLTMQYASNRIDFSNTGVINFVGQWTASHGFSKGTGKYTVNNGDWNTGTTWNSGTLPGINDDVTILHNIQRNGTYKIKNLTIANGAQLWTNNGANRLTITGTTDLYGKWSDFSNGSNDTLNGLLTIYSSGTWNSTGVTTNTNLRFRGGIVNNGVFNAGAAVFIDNNQQISGSSIYTFNGDVLIGNSITLTNKSILNTNGLNGSNASSTFINDTNTVLNYSFGSARPMATGILDVDQPYNTVNYNRNNTQDINITNYWNLSISNGNTKTFFTNGKVKINGNLSIASSTLLQSQSAAGNDTIFINGKLINNGTLNLRRANNQFHDVILTGKDTIINGNGGYTFRNLICKNALSKIIASTSTMQINIAADSTSAFINEGGDLNGTNTIMINGLNGATRTTIGGGGKISINALNIGGANNHGIVAKMMSNLVVNNILFNVSGNGVLDLNGNDLTINGNITRTSAGKFKGHTNSSIFVNGSGNPSNNLTFETSILGTTNYFDTLLINRAASGIVTLGNSISVGNLIIQQGTLATTVNVTLTNKFINAGIYNQTGGRTSFMMPGTLTLTGTNTFNKVLINSGTTVNNPLTNTSILDTLDGIDGTSVWYNDLLSVLNYAGGTKPMLKAGVFDVDQARNTVNYNRMSGNQVVDSTIYWTLIIEGPNSGNTSRNKDFAGNITVLDNLIIRRQNPGTGTGNVYARYGTFDTITVTVKGNLILENNQCYMQVQTTGVAGHILIVEGRIINDGYLEIHPNANSTQYGDIIMTGSGTGASAILSGNGILRTRNLYLSGTSDKESTMNQVQIWWGSASLVDTFSNTGGAFIQTSGTFAIKAWGGVNVNSYLGLTGNAPISFNVLSVGSFNDHVLNVYLGSNISVNGNLNFYTDDNARFYLNGKTLTLNGNHTQDTLEKCKLRGSTTSTLIINGNGKFTSPLEFDQTFVGLTNVFKYITINRGIDTVFFTNPVSILTRLTLTSGILNNATYLTLSDTSTISRSKGQILAPPTLLGTVNIEYTDSLATGPELPTLSTKLRDLIIKTNDSTDIIHFGSLQPTVNRYLNYQNGIIQIDTAQYIKFVTTSRVRLSIPTIKTILPIGTTNKTPLSIKVRNITGVTTLEIRDGFNPSKPAYATSYLNKYIRVAGNATARNIDLDIHYKPVNVVGTEKGLYSVAYIASAWNFADTVNTITHVASRKSILSNGDYTAFNKASDDARLSNLTISSGSLLPLFDSAVVVYVDTVMYATNQLTVTPTASNVNAAITVDGIGVNSGTASSNINLNIGNNTITIEVTAQNNVSKKTYVINVYRYDNVNIAEILGSDSKIYPNPVIDHLTIDFENNYTGVISLEIINEKGSIVSIFNDYKSTAHYTKSLNLQALSAGSYIVVVTLNENKISIPFVKK